VGMPATIRFMAALATTDMYGGEGNDSLFGEDGADDPTAAMATTWSLVGWATTR
jgi:hypothetical protein